uniref:Uncharacterized protein n=1 Tax=Rhizophora mucronata TaxID=61149 RepID=A0A2P2L3B9_RHIMU
MAQPLSCSQLRNCCSAMHMLYNPQENTNSFW